MSLFSFVKSAGTSAKEPEKEQRKKEKERVWKDPNEQVKYVCQGGRALCKFASPPIANIVVTSTTVLLQDKPWATIKDKNGRINFNFLGICLHPSQQKPCSPPPPCKMVITLGAWRNYSETMIDNYNALLVKSKIPCLISGQDLTIIDSGQRAELSLIALNQTEKKIENKE